MYEKMHESGSTKIIHLILHLTYLGPVSCVFIFWVSWGLTIGRGYSLIATRWQVFFPPCVSSGLTGSHWRAAIADDCDILCLLMWQEIFHLSPSKVTFQRRQRHPTPVLLPGKSHGRRSLVGCSLRGRWESDTTKWLPTFTFHFHALEKEMATHSSVLAWRIPGTGEPGGLLSMGSHRVRHDWSDLAAAAAAGSWVPLT